MPNKNINVKTLPLEYGRDWGECEEKYRNENGMDEESNKTFFFFLLKEWASNA